MLTLGLCLGYWAAGQVETVPHPDKEPAPSQAPPRSERDQEAGETSSRDTRIDLSPPKDEAKDHPVGETTVTDSDTDMSYSDVQEFHPWNPHKAAKDVEVGYFYFKRKNYRAALDRYKEALYWKHDDAIANFRMGECLEKLQEPEEARLHYEAYLKVLPQGPLSEDARKALDRLKGSEEKPKN